MVSGVGPSKAGTIGLAGFGRPLEHGKVSVRYRRIGRILRGRRLDRNPLRRRLDRVETVILVALLAGFLGGAPFAAHAAATWTAASSQRELQAQHANFRQVTAVLLDEAWTPVGFGVTLNPQAIARWVAPDGAIRTGVITVPAGDKTGDRVPVWTNLSGQLVAPLQRDQIAVRADLAAAAAVTVLCVVLLVTAAIIRRVLNRRRLAAWEADWLATGPRWTSRR